MFDVATERAREKKPLLLKWALMARNITPKGVLCPCIAYAPS